MKNINSVKGLIKYCVLTSLLLAMPLGVLHGQDESADTGASGSGAGQIVLPLSGRGLVSGEINLAVTPTTLDMGEVEVGASRTMSASITHNGDVNSAPIQIGEVSLFGQAASNYSFAGFDGNTTLNAGDTVTIDVTLQPTVPGNMSAGLRMEVVDATAPFVLLLSGSAQFVLSSNLGLSDQALSFGQVLQEASASTNLILTNLGEALAPNINIFSIELSGTNADAFSVLYQATTLAPGENLDLQISALTDEPGFKSATIEITHDGNNGSQSIPVTATIVDPNAPPVNFSLSSVLSDHALDNPTTLQFGPDGKLYIGELDGPVQVFDISRTSANNYTATLFESIDLIRLVLNYNDDGSRDFGEPNRRLLTGIHVTGTATNPVIYAVSSDPRQAAGPSTIEGGNDSNLDTNSGILHKLTRNNDNTWTKIDLVRGLPRSEENHVPNGLVKVGNTIYVNIGGNTNEGLPSTNFATLPEYALSAAVLAIDLDMIGDVTYDIPTLDAGNGGDDNDPFGGADGLNQAMLVENGPISIFASGLRNSYDIVHTESGRFYVWDNGSNTGWGGPPDASCLNNFSDSGARDDDGLHLISQGYYAGHPNPTRGNKANTFGGQSPIEGAANPEECVYLESGTADGALVTQNPSTNGLDEYTASNFFGEMTGDLLAIALDQNLYRVKFNSTGDAVVSKEILQASIGVSPLDVTTQSDNQVFPGTIWVVDLFGNELFVLEPEDY